jgi:hypothetical protein
VYVNSRLSRWAPYPSQALHVAGSIVHGATVVVSSGHGQTVVNVGVSVVGNGVGVGVGLLVGCDAAGDTVQPAQVFIQFSLNRG